jgi:hypothetical protein
VIFMKHRALLARFRSAQIRGFKSRIGFEPLVTPVALGSWRDTLNLKAPLRLPLDLCLGPNCNENLLIPECLSREVRISPSAPTPHPSNPLEFLAFLPIAVRALPV